MAAEYYSGNTGEVLGVHEKQRKKNNNVIVSFNRKHRSFLGATEWRYIVPITERFTFHSV
jgi:hypothetical protein